MAPPEKGGFSEPMTLEVSSRRGAAEAMLLWRRRANWVSMTERPRSEDCVRRPEPLTDVYGENRHELVQKLAYEHGEKRGSPLGSFGTDWLAAEKEVRTYLSASGIELGSDEELYS